MWPTSRATRKRSAAPGQVGAAAPTPSFASSLWWKAARTCCSQRAWAHTPRARTPWPRTCWGLSTAACCAWQTAASSASRCGSRHSPRRHSCCGGAGRTCALPASSDLPMAPTEYRLQGVADAEPIYRLVTSVLDAQQAPADELAALYHERWEIETALDELKTHLRGARIVLRSKTADLVRQEFYGLLMAHFAVRALMHEAALKANVDPDRLSFLHAVRVVRRKLHAFNAIPPSAEESLP